MRLSIGCHKSSDRGQHHTVVSLGFEAPLHLGAGCSIWPKQGQIRMPSAVGHLLQGKSDAGIDSLGVHARGQHGISEIHGFRLPTYEQNARNLTLPLCGFSALLPNSLAPSPGFLIACQWFRFTPRGEAPAYERGTLVTPGLRRRKSISRRRVNQTSATANTDADD